MPQLDLSVITDDYEMLRAGVPARTEHGRHGRDMA